MVGPSKILTVSYGTFSCTLEGFDEPFNTMKAIAEYFRDLAAEDRYFGAEPPTPDAEMLHRIAEREIKRRVEAKIQDNGVILRPQIGREEADLTPGPVDGAGVMGTGAAVGRTRRDPGGVAASAVEAATSAPPGAALTAHAAATARVAPVAPAADAEALSGISAKLQRIRAAVAQVRAFDETDEEDATPASVTDPLVTDPNVPPPLPPEAFAGLTGSLDAARVEAERQAAEEAARAEAERLAAEEAARVEAERLAAEEAARVEAERLAAEEAARVEAERLAAEEAARVEAERLAAEEAARAEAERLAAEEAALTEADLAEAERKAMEVALRAGAARLAAERAAEEAAQATTPPPAPQTPDAPRQTRRVVVVRPAPGKPVAQPAAAPGRVDAADSVRAAMATFAQAELADEDVAPAPARTRDGDDPAAQLADEAPVAAPVPSPADAAMAEDDEAPLSDAALQARVADALGDTGLPAEDEAELLAELAAVERDAETVRQAERQRRTILRDETADASVDRLISQADTQFSDVEAQRRQSTISHLKAAVVATRAEEEASGPRHPEADEQREIARYRADLERSVRRPDPAPGAAPGATPDDGAPHRPARPTAHRTERPRSAQPPLVLVSEQRIDRPAETEIVRPRRISTGTLAMEELYDEDAPAAPAPRGRAFADFVGPMHLTTLAELTEAAAAYVTHVDGASEFPRPQVMRHVASLDLPMTRSRENMLRSFGVLLRQGTLLRARRGQFELAPGSEFGEQAQRFSQGG